MPAGWLEALAEPESRPRLRLMHGEPSRAWHLEELAGACAMSRTSFAVHFKSVSARRPARLSHRMAHALPNGHCAKPRTPIASIARSLVYLRKSAFSNAFKRVNGKSPSAYRSGGGKIGFWKKES